MKYSPLLSAIIAWLMFAAAALLFISSLTSCATHLHYTGWYKVKTVQSASDSSSIVTFHHIKGKYQVLTDTLRPGSKVHIKVMHMANGKPSNIFKPNN